MSEFLFTLHIGLGAAYEDYQVATYVPGTSTPRNTYTSRDCTPGTENTNPIRLNSIGACTLYANQPVKLKFMTPAGVEIPAWGVDNWGFEARDYLQGYLVIATSGTTGNSYAGTVTPSPAALENGLTVVLIPDADSQGTLGATVFTGTGIDDATFSGRYTGSTDGSVYLVQIETLTKEDTPDAPVIALVPTSTLTITGIDTTNDTVTIVGHGLLNTDKVTFRQSGGADPGGLVTDDGYWVIYVDDDTLQLAATEADAKSGTQIDITTTGAGTLTLDIGHCVNGTHSVKTTLVNAAGETLPSVSSNVVTVDDSNKQILVTPTHTPGDTITHWRVYMTVSGNAGDYKLVSEDIPIGTATYTINILDSGLGAAAPTTNTAEDANTIKWRKDAGAWTTGVTITGEAQLLAEGVYFTFGNITGHTVDDYWSLTVNRAAQFTLASFDAKRIYQNIAGTWTVLDHKSLTANSPAKLSYSESLNGYLLTNPPLIAENQIQSLSRVTKAAAYTLLAADKGKLFSCNGTWALTLDPAADLGAGWFVYIRNSGSGIITLTADGSEIIHGINTGASASTYDIAPNTTIAIQCDAINFQALFDTGGVPTGAIMPYGAATAPIGYLMCDGSAVSRTTYSYLFNIIGTTYGPGDGSTTFNVPDMRGYFPFGKSTAGTGSSLGSTFGAIDHAHSGETLVIPALDLGPTPGGGGPDLADAGGAGAYDVHTIASAPTGDTDTSNPPGLVFNFIIKY